MRHLMPFLAAGALVLSTAVAYASAADEFAKLLPDDGAENDRFGYSVAISGGLAIVGAYRDDDNVCGLCVFGGVQSCTVGCK